MEPYASRIKDVLERRARAGRFAPGVAAYSDSDMFKKAPVSSVHTSHRYLFRDNADFAKVPDAPRSKRWDSTSSSRPNPLTPPTPTRLTHARPLHRRMQKQAPMCPKASCNLPQDPRPHLPRRRPPLLQLLPLHLPLPNRSSPPFLLQLRSPHPHHRQR